MAGFSHREKLYCFMDSLADHAVYRSVYVKEDIAYLLFIGDDYVISVLLNFQE